MHSSSFKKVDDAWTMLFNILSQFFWKSALLCSKVFQNLFGQVYLFGAEMTGKLCITALHVGSLTMIVVFGL